MLSWLKNNRFFGLRVGNYSYLKTWFSSPKMWAIFKLDAIAKNIELEMTFMTPEEKQQCVASFYRTTQGKKGAPLCQLIFITPQSLLATAFAIHGRQHVRLK
ncbi:MAG: hypothetical protein L3J89_08305 [Gammaproteobacteria bacterium]|nr:hypothetical protein [Gammaproteobacteria bacterium]